MGVGDEGRGKEGVGWGVDGRGGKGRDSEDKRREGGSEKTRVRGIVKTHFCHCSYSYSYSLYTTQPTTTNTHMTTPTATTYQV